MTVYLFNSFGVKLTPGFFFKLRNSGVNSNSNKIGFFTARCYLKKNEAIYIYIFNNYTIIKYEIL